MEFRVFLCVLCAFACGFLAGCGRQSNPTGAQQGGKGVVKLTLISPHWEGIQREFEIAFGEHMRKKGKKVKLEWVHVGGGTSAILRYVRTNFEKNPNGIGIDLMWGGGTEPYLVLQKEGLLQPHTPPKAILKNIPPKLLGVPLYETKHHWFGTALSGFGIAYNKVVLKNRKLPQPKVWEDLTHPKLYEWVELTDPRRSGSAHMMFEIILQAYGWEKGWAVLVKMAGNAKKWVQDSSDAVTDVANGEVAVAPSIDFYAWAKIADVGEKLMGFVYPKGLTVINPDSIGILKGAPQLELAKEFVNFVLSEEGQKLWLLPKGTKGGPKQFTLARMSVIPKLYETLKGKSVVTVNPFELKSALKFDAEKGAARWDALNSLIGATLIDMHLELRDAWGRIRPAPSSPDSNLWVSKLVQPPVREKQLIRWAKERWKDKAFVAKKEAEWAKWAKRKYVSAGLILPPPPEQPF